MLCPLLAWRYAGCCLAGRCTNYLVVRAAMAMFGDIRFVNQNLAIMSASAATLNLPTARRASTPMALVWHGVPLYVYAVTLASLLVIVGILWDISWHRTIGRDAFLSAPHLLIYLGAVFGGLFSGIQVLWNSFWGSAETKAGLIKLWVVFYSSLGAMFCIWGAVAMLTSAPFDDWWHNTYGLDVTILSPPHTVLALGMVFMQVGACVSVSKYLNAELEQTPNSPKVKLLRALFVVAAGSLLCMMATLLTEETLPRSQRAGMYYLLITVVGMLFLPAFKKALRLKWGACTVAAAYVAIVLLCNWILQCFPAQPKLGPILNHVTHFQPQPFPTLLFLPALIIDLTMNKPSWHFAKKAALMALGFVAVLLLVQYPLSGFLLESPWSRNWFFGGYSWEYNNNPEWPGRYKFMPGEADPLGTLAKWCGAAIGIGFLVAMASQRWGTWFTKIRR
ncbi:MAG: hypothetical protein EAY75_10355 [Bacteroidetes bacterium]|nr:MAG: hypothetical protein EAY75_10355 [Bacteroidota bacterium]